MNAKRKGKLNGHDAMAPQEPTPKPPAQYRANEPLTQEYLIGCHPFLTPEQARDLLAFCQAATIRLVGCYGDGSIMLPKFLST